jgi:hypothetical protein
MKQKLEPDQAVSNCQLAQAAVRLIEQVVVGDKVEGKVSRERVDILEGQAAEEQVFLLI